MNRSLWTSQLTQDSIPAWPCPICGSNTVKLVPKSLVHKETSLSRSEHSHEDWGPEWIAYVFTAWAKCNHSGCGNEMAISGTGGVDMGFDDEGASGWEDYFAPKFCAPMPDIITLPKKCPEDIRNEFRAAFASFWSDASSTVNHIRIGLERIMDYLGVQRRRKLTSGKFWDLTLHQRIEVFAKAQVSVGSQLMALKWLGNAGSHGEQINRDDILDAFEILEHALTEVIERRSEKVAELTKKLTKRHAPTKKK
jgi:hypothetical protein